MHYHSPQFQNIADQAADFARPLILQTIRDLSADFTAKFPHIARFMCLLGMPEPQTNDKRVVLFSDNPGLLDHPLFDFLIDVTQKDLIGFCPDIVLQPEILVDGVPIEEAIEKAQQKTFVVLRSTGCGYDYAREVLYAGPDYHTAKHIVLTDHRKEDEEPNPDHRQDLEHWYGGRCLDVEEYSPEDFKY